MKTRIFLPFLLIAISILIVNCGEQSNSSTAYCWTTNLNVREIPKSSGKVIHQLQKNEAVQLTGNIGDSLFATIDGNQIQANWIEILTIKGDTGWVFSGALSCKTDSSFVFDNGLTEMPEEGKRLYMPAGRETFAYVAPHPGAEVIQTFTKLRVVYVAQEVSISEECLGYNRDWVQVSVYDNRLFDYWVLKDNLREFEQITMDLDTNMRDLEWFFGEEINDDVIYYKSVKKFKNGDDGATWEEESQLNFMVDSKVISTGYMYTYEDMHIKGFTRKGNVYTFIYYVFSENDLYEIQLRFNKNRSISILGEGEIAGKYVQGKAANY